MHSKYHEPHNAVDGVHLGVIEGEDRWHLELLAMMNTCTAVKTIRSPGEIAACTI
jgi:hypothetical protein